MELKSTLKWEFFLSLFLSEANNPACISMDIDNWAQLKDLLTHICTNMCVCMALVGCNEMKEKLVWKITVNVLAIASHAACFLFTLSLSLSLSILFSFYLMLTHRDSQFSSLSHIFFFSAVPIHWSFLPTTPHSHRLSCFFLRESESLFSTRLMCVSGAFYIIYGCSWERISERRKKIIFQFNFKRQPWSYS